MLDVRIISMIMLMLLMFLDNDVVILDSVSFWYVNWFII